MTSEQDVLMKMLLRLADAEPRLYAGLIAAMLPLPPTLPVEVMMFDDNVYDLPPLQRAQWYRDRASDLLAQAEKLTREASACERAAREIGDDYGG